MNPTLGLPKALLMRVIQAIVITAWAVFGVVVVIGLFKNSR